ncbi:glycine--tRNA ligase subunit beta [Parasphingorhabdus sp. DH2-15]|uniref:glycine--tRNA ligase subunit beta n=1 Tax=Parasphingorhabdus sp. DH2-15 TaxID=3444112 RepID=UPI003F684132
MSDFLLELLSEEIPARMQAKARADLERLFAGQLADAGLQAASITTYSTPRRLALIAADIPDETQAIREKVKGPPAAAPVQAIDGFCRKNGLSRDQLEVRDVKGRATYFAVIDTPGRATSDVLAEIIPAIVRAFPWPKSQRWGAASISSESLKWVRPLQGIIALLGSDIVDCAVDGIASDRVTIGHRFHFAGEVITINSASDYIASLEGGHVLVDHERRAAIIRDGAAKAAADAGLVLVEDEGLVIENAGLTEWPVPLLGRYDPAFLDVPPEVIQLTARVNQKYFICRDKEGALAPAFICTANIDARDGGAAVIAGNEKVLAARLADAKFFWELDQKTTLAVHATKLSNIVFHERLGTVAQKVGRVAKLAEWLVFDAKEPNGDHNFARQAAQLCKADLVTEMVGEFPELQGLMGGYYAEKEGLDPQVANAIRDHYKPVGASDDVPTAPISVAVSLADKLDNLLSFFKIEIMPTGSKDPFALRRAALGYLRLVQANNLHLSIDTVVHAWHGRPHANLATTLLDFLLDRLSVQLRDQGIRFDFIDASRTWQGQNDMRVDRVEARARALTDFITTEDGTNLLACYKRAANILKKEVGDNGLPAPRGDYHKDPAEAALITALATAKPAVVAAVAEERFADAMQALASLRAPIDQFFTDVTVNDSDEAKRSARLALLKEIRDAVHSVADFSKIEG